mmetsp:Transcript_24810/g.61125  ORF Transcript_24810/g.61125 Transcript_24810/m.61125 type:complete len:281 (-) Transcript_24810:214-1056(-)
MSKDLSLMHEQRTLTPLSHPRPASLASLPLSLRVAAAAPTAAAAAAATAAAAAAAAAAAPPLFLPPPPLLLTLILAISLAAAPAAAATAKVDVLDPHATLLYRQFAEALVRVAHLKFHDLPGLERRLNKLVTEFLLPSYAPGAPTTLPWDDAMGAHDVKAAAAGRAQAAFAAVPRDEEARPPVVTARAFLGFLKSTGALTDGEPAGTPVVIAPPESIEVSNEDDDEGEEEAAEATKDGEAAEEVEVGSELASAKAAAAAAAASKSPLPAASPPSPAGSSN